MKKIVLTITTLTAILFCSSSFKLDLERIQAISTAINVLGNNKTDMDSYLSKLGFVQDSKHKNRIEYKKSTNLGNYTYTTSYKNGKLNAVSWNEAIVFTNGIINELLANEFEKFSDDPETNIYGYRNIEENILVTLTINNYSKQVIVSIGPLNSKLPIKKDISQEQGNNVIIQSEDIDSLSNNFGKRGSALGEIYIALREFTNLVMPHDDGEETGKIAVRIKINKSGIVIDAIPGVRGTTLTDKELWEKCKDAVMGAQLTPSESAPDVQIGLIIFSFKAK